MRKLVVFLFLSIFSHGQEINWITMDEAVERQIKNPKKIIIDMYTTWCGPCRMLDRNTFSNKRLAEYVEKRSQLMGLKMESNLRDIMKDKDLFPSHTPPIKIVIAPNTDKP